MKKYIKQKIKRISLDPDQAVLQVCMVDGGVFWGFGTLDGCVHFRVIGAGETPCNTAVKGVGGDSPAMHGATMDQKPS
ncbi:MAG: hypothetical protein PHQ52_07070 [Candidatus Omnitrophica bacterium]|nr:hypothetical protein [Candidatus Omnitrophota bacterium]